MPEHQTSSAATPSNHQDALLRLMEQRKEITSSSRQLARQLVIETLTPLMEEFKIEKIDVLVGNADHLQFEVKPFLIDDRSYTFDFSEIIPDDDEQDEHREGMMKGKKEFASFMQKLAECEEKICMAFLEKEAASAQKFRPHFSTVFAWDTEDFEDLVSVEVPRKHEPKKTKRLSR